MEFVSNRALTLELVDGAKGKSETDKQVNKKENGKRVNLAVTSAAISYHYCKGDHTLYKCETFMKLPVSQRRHEIQGTIMSELP